MPKKNGKRKKRVKGDLKASNPSSVTSRKAKKKKLTSNHQTIETSPIKANNEERSISLPSLLKRHRGIAATTPLPPEWSGIEKFAKASVPKFLAPRDGEDFDSCRKECYRGFHWEEPETLPSSFHESFKHALHSLNSSGLFLYDIVQPGGKRSSQTFVTRTLIGAPGSTYKYLGLRLFSHPWCEVDSRGDGDVGSSNKKNVSTGKRLSLVNDLGYSKQCAKALIEIGQINQDLIQRTKKALHDEIVPHVDKELVGSAEYSLTLINRMEPSSVKKNLKMDKIHGMGKTSVSWHKDSGLQDFSSIAVYHTMEQYGESFQGFGSDQQEQWKVALRVADSSSQTPALSVPLPSGALYYLLDDLNHQHEHAVVAGSESLRYSSTHRVAREGCGTWQYIRDKCEKVLSSPLCSEALSDYEKFDDFIKSFNNTSKRKQLEKAVRSCESLMTELEFEWIRQWYIQGHHHADLHPYWHRPMEKMLFAYESLSKVSCSVLKVLEQSSRTTINCVSEDLFDIVIESFETRSKMRSVWLDRLDDSVFSSIPEQMRPISSGKLDNGEMHKPSTIRKWRSYFVSIQDNVMKGGGKKKRKSSSLTKKEKKKVNSNWESMKKAIQKK